MSTYCLSLLASVAERAKLVTLCLVILVLIVILRPFLAFYLDLYVDSRSSHGCNECEDVNLKNESIPRIIHQIFYPIKSEEMPPEWKSAQQTWIKMNPDFKYVLWNSSSVAELITTEYQYLWDTYCQYEHWVQRIDVAKYVILHKHGGVYADIDIECLESMHDVLKTLPKNTAVFLYDAYPWGKAAEFIIAKRKHPFMAAVVQGLVRAHRWYLVPYARPMFTTGPMYFGGRFLAFRNKDDIFVLNKKPTFLYNKHGSSWHSADGTIINFVYKPLSKILSVKMVVLFISLVILFILFRIYRNRKSKNER